MSRPLTGPAPKLKAPADACDTHMHFYNSKYPKHPDGPVPPPDATVADYRQVQRRLGLDRVVIVQANAYGDDNSCTLDAVAELGQDKARAVVVVKPGVADAELERLTQAGARAIRIMCLPGGHLKWDVMDEMIARVRPFGWHPIVQFDGAEFDAREPQLARIEGDYIIDHVGKFLDLVPADHPAFQAMLRLVERGNCYVKLSAPYEFSRSGPPGYDDVGVLAKALVKAAPERMLWASNWPHPGAKPYPDDAELLDVLLEWAPDEGTRQQILVTNPARLYGFADVGSAKKSRFPGVIPAEEPGSTDLFVGSSLSKSE